MSAPPASPEAPRPETYGREIALDVETTGLDAAAGDRVVEIGCVELQQLLPSGREFQTYVNPERPMSGAAAEITGFTDAFLADKPRFSDVAAQLLAFIGDARLVIHNAQFDVGFLNAEFARLDAPPLQYARVTDSLELARARFPGQANSLDALCRRFEVDNTARDKHGALLDAQLLAEVYLELRGGRQRGLELGARASTSSHAPTAPDTQHKNWPTAPARPAPLAARVSDADKEAHARFLQETITDALWLRAPRD